MRASDDSDETVPLQPSIRDNQLANLLQYKLTWVAPFAFVCSELGSLTTVGTTLLALLTDKYYGSYGDVHGAIMQAHVWCASLMWLLGAL